MTKIKIRSKWSSIKLIPGHDKFCVRDFTEAVRILLVAVVDDLLEEDLDGAGPTGSNKDHFLFWKRERLGTIALFKSY
jgi:hypothetical protein